MQPKLCDYVCMCCPGQITSPVFCANLKVLQAILMPNKVISTAKSMFMFCRDKNTLTTAGGGESVNGRIKGINMALAFNLCARISPARIAPTPHFPCKNTHCWPINAKEFRFCQLAFIKGCLLLRALSLSLSLSVSLYIYLAL